MCRYLFFFVPILAIFANTAYPQELRWKTGFNGFFDNREYFNEYVQPQSILGARTFVEGGFVVDDKSEFGVGIDYMYELGSKQDTKYLKPILYYHYNNKSSEFYMGAFPRYNLIKLPLILQTDTFNYYKVNVEGIYLSFNKPWGEQNLWLDWTSRQTLEDRETFLIGATGKVNYNVGFAEYNFLMYHYAGTAAEGSATEGPATIRDNGGFVGIVGANLSSYTLLDSLSISTGITWSYDRLRTIYNMRYYYGNLSEFYARYKSFGIRSTMYFGDGQVQMVGDGFYLSPIYNRTDLILNLFKNSRVKASFEFSFHFIPSITDYSQKFTIYIAVNSRKKM